MLINLQELRIVNPTDAIIEGYKNEIREGLETFCARIEMSHELLLSILKDQSTKIEFELFQSMMQLKEKKDVKN